LVIIFNKRCGIRLWRKWTENPCVASRLGGQTRPHLFRLGEPQKTLTAMLGFFIVKIIMYTVYILFSNNYKKTYVGYTNDIDRRITEHNITATKGFTKKYRPCTLIYTEVFETKSEASKRELFLKTGIGRNFVKQTVEKYIGNHI
jgi:putative endonuclease